MLTEKERERAFEVLKFGYRRDFLGFFSSAMTMWVCHPSIGDFKKENEKKRRK